MPRPAPEVMEKIVEGLIEEFEKEPPKFIVDSRKRHVPMERPPYELWPIAPKGFMRASKGGFLPLDTEIIEVYDKGWAQFLRTNFDEGEAARYEALKPFREYVMQKYERVEPVRRFWPHVLFRLKNTAPN